MTYGTDPHFWPYETTGILRPAVEAYLAGSMSPIQIAAMRAYLRQWIDAPAWEHLLGDPDDRAWLKGMRRRVGGLETFAAVQEWIDEATDAGMDPI
jgi:hypothetical protein